MAKLPPMRNTAVQLQRLARERADEQSRRIPWQRLLDTRNQYIGWQEFYLWARSILEVEEQIPDWLVDILKERCPGFLERDKTLTSKAMKEKPLALRLEDWIDEHIFGFAKNEGWFNAITYYAVRDPRYQRAEVCWSGCVEKWRRAKPIPYPSFEEWKGMASQCDDTAHLVPNERRARVASKRVDPDAWPRRPLNTWTGRLSRAGLAQHWNAHPNSPPKFEASCGPVVLDSWA